MTAPSDAAPDTAQPKPPVVTDEAAAILALHCAVVQGGVSTPEAERRRLLTDAARQDDPQGFIDATVARFAAEIAAAEPPPPATDDAAAAEAADAPADAPPDPTIPIAKVRRYKELRALQNAGEAEAKAYKDEADQLERELVEAFADAGVQNVNVDGKTVYLHRSVYAQRKPGVTTDDVKQALRDAGVGELVTETVNSNTLSAYVRELTEDDDAPGLPPAVAAVLEPGERFGVRIIAGGTKAKSKTHSK